MEEKKHIDRLYQEKFKDFEATPREAVWKSISARLQDNNNKKPVYPLWYKLAGVAAVFALFISYANGLFKSGNTENSSMAAEVADKEFGVIRLVSSSYSENMINGSAALQSIMAQTQMLQAAQQKAIYSSDKKNSEGTEKNVAIASADNFNREKSESTFNFRTTALAANKAEDNKKKPHKSLKPLPIPDEAEVASEEASVALSNSKRLRITTIAAPVYSDKFGKGSSIDALFTKNETSGELTMSYGVNLAYKISEKIKIRSGVNKVDLSYNTNNITFTATVNPSTLAGVNYNDGVPNYRIENSGVRRFGNISASSEFNPASIISPVAGHINQRFGFIEVPLEVEYSLIDKRIGLNIIGGGSTFFLNNSEITLNSNNFTTRLGKASNLNEISFSTNIGLGLDYKLTPNFQLNLEPVFKYQINTFSNSTGDANPYYLGVYSGFSLKF